MMGIPGLLGRSHHRHLSAGFLGAFNFESRSIIGQTTESESFGAPQLLLDISKYERVHNLGKIVFGSHSIWHHKETNMRYFVICSHQPIKSATDFAREISFASKSHCLPLPGLSVIQLPLTVPFSFSTNFTTERFSMIFYVIPVLPELTDTDN
jgi:hypothetical protein